MKASKEGRGKNVRAGVAGAGVGTALLLVAKAIPETHATFREILINASPTISVGASAVTLYGLRRWKLWQSKREIAAAEKNLYNAANEALLDSNASENHKAKVQTTVEEYQLKKVEYSLKEINGLQAMRRELFESNE